MDREEHVETLEGHGRIFHKGSVVLPPVRYRIDISQQIHVSRTMGGGHRSETPGLGTIEGVLLPPIPLNLIGEPIELQLEDGRRWKCFLQSSHGTLVNRGGIE